MITLILALAAQPTSAQLPPPSADEQAVLAPVNGLFEAIKAKDGNRILALANPQGRLTAVSGSGTPKVLSWGEYAGRYKPGEGPVFEERFLGEPAIESDRDIALVWGPYQFLADGKVVACGTNHFDLIREGGQWKLFNVTWSQRKPGDCSAP